MAGSIVVRSKNQVRPDQGYEDPEEEDILDYYLKELSYAAQTWYSMRVALSSVWRKLQVAAGAEATKEKLKSFWTTMGVVSALLLGVTFNNTVSPVSSDDEDMQTAVNVATVFGGLSLVMSLAVIICTVVYILEIDNCITERDLTDFIRNYGTLFDLLLGVFSASVVLLLAQMLTTMYITYDRTCFYIVISCAASAVFFFAIIAAIVAGRNRFILWARFDSPKARERAAAIAAAKAAGKAVDVVASRT